MNPSGDEFNEDEPLTASMQAREEQTSSEAEGRLRRTAHKVSAAAGDTWAQTKEKAGMARQRTEFFLREIGDPLLLQRRGEGNRSKIFTGKPALGVSFVAFLLAVLQIDQRKISRLGRSGERGRRSRQEHRHPPLHKTGPQTLEGVDELRWIVQGGSASPKAILNICAYGA